MYVPLRVDPFLYQILPKNETHFYTRATKFIKMSHYFSKLLSFQAKFRNYCIRLMKLGLFSCQFKKILKYDACLYQFLHWIGVIIISEGWFWDLCISAARPQIDHCTKTPLPMIMMKETHYIKNLDTDILSTCSIRLISLISMLWYSLRVETETKKTTKTKQTNREKQLL